ncbi:hypothetical protein ACFZA2_04620 [Microbacterium sp. NPDC007973]|uniref:hypothetical protein n=1 Tax=Microbacterium sp. NPDC007973 TaxID=3364182 RepID=UPI0036E1A272
MVDSTYERETSVRRPWRLILVASFLAFLAIQGFISFKVRPEPYPMVRMPSFGLAAGTDGTYPVTFVSGSVEFDDGTSADIDPYAIMSTLRFSTARPSLDYVFAPPKGENVSPHLKEWLRGRVQDVTGRDDISDLRLCWEDARVDVKDASVSDRQPCRVTEVTL